MSTRSWTACAHPGHRQDREAPGCEALEDIIEALDGIMVTSAPRCPSRRPAGSEARDRTRSVLPLPVIVATQVSGFRDQEPASSAEVFSDCHRDPRRCRCGPRYFRRDSSVALIETVRTMAAITTKEVTRRAHRVDPRLLRRPSAGVICEPAAYRRAHGCLPP